MAQVQMNQISRLLYPNEVYWNLSNEISGLRNSREDKTCNADLTESMVLVNFSEASKKMFKEPYLTLFQLSELKN